MKSAVVIIDGLTQIVLTPENEMDKKIVAILPNTGVLDASVFRGTFYECRGGWHRQGPQGSSDDSLILRLTNNRPEQGSTT